MQNVNYMCIHRPQGENSFYLEEADAQVSFKKDASGVVTGLKLVQRGQTMIAKKIK